MTGYDITKSILSFSAENPKVKANHIAVFIYFGEICNECNWVSKIQISREKVLRITGIGGQRTYKNVLNDLADWKAIKIHSYSENQFNPYDVIEIEKGFVKKSKSLLNHNEFINTSLSNQSDDIYNKTIELKNFKTINDILSFFEKKDLNNSHLLDHVNRFVKFLDESSQLEFFLENFNNYQKFKEISGEPTHRNLDGFIGTPEKNYEDGAWKSTNYKNSLAQFEQKQTQLKTQKSRDSKKEDIENGKIDVIRRLSDG